MDPFLGEIKIFAGNYAPVNYAFCYGQSLSIDQYDALYSLLGTKYGTTGPSTFKLSDLRGRAVMDYGCSPYGSCHQLGELGGHETVQLTEETMPSHNHALKAVDANANSESPAGNYPARGGIKSGKITNPWPSYADGAPGIAMAAETVVETGLNHPHENRQPYLVLNYCLSVKGLWPSRPTQ